MRHDQRDTGTSRRNVTRAAVGLAAAGILGSALDAPASATTTVRPPICWEESQSRWCPPPPPPPPPTAPTFHTLTRDLGTYSVDNGGQHVRTTIALHRDIDNATGGITRSYITYVDVVHNDLFFAGWHVSVSAQLNNYVNGQSMSTPVHVYGVTPVIAGGGNEVSASYTLDVPAWVTAPLDPGLVPAQTTSVRFVQYSDVFFHS